MSTHTSGLQVGRLNMLPSRNNILYKNAQWFRVDLVSKAVKGLYHSTLPVRVMKKKKKEEKICSHDSPSATAAIHPGLSAFVTPMPVDPSSEWEHFRLAQANILELLELYRT